MQGIENVSALQARGESLPVKGKLTALYACSALMALLTGAASFAGLCFPTLIYPTNELVRVFLPNDVVNLSIGLPVLLGSMWLARRGQWVGLLCWMGALFFLLYNYTAYVFAMPIGAAFLVHLALLILGVYALAGLIGSTNGGAVRQRLGGAVRERLAGGVLAGLGLAFFLRAAGVAFLAINSGAPPSEAEFAVNVSDLMITPAWVIGGILLWRRSEPGYVIGLGLLLQGSMLFIALIIFLLIQPRLTGVPFAAADAAVVFVMGLICFVPFGIFVRGVVSGHRTSPI